eukprot:CAMPEP_0115731974 /NCGR_PEP_ID=MMETSP0272-20121206/84870_1 /TAXON_ID=71861 /ORGANISM="Scrippsiella trochoidea, Strain CCMP3099" /LENGTH=54 /DNA_ID=CAMNT_0003175845 /DNA_START=108 /DNA_END=269 /DNA_ORIENTATION=-
MSRGESTPMSLPSWSCTTTWWHAQDPAIAFATIRSATSDSSIVGFTINFCTRRS